MDEHKHHGPGFSNGFILGVIVGAALVFFLGTKKGKQILKTLTENGIEGISDLREMMEEDVMEEEEAYTANGQMTPEPEHSVTHPVKRFFRGVKK